jgi:rhodanese-related sulfurtransferase
MNPPKRLKVTFPPAGPLPDLGGAIDAFHRFIQRGLVEGLILDVADYRHVPQGPGVLLVGHDVDYGLAEDGFSVVRKRSLEDDAATQLRDALRMGLGALAAVADDVEFDVAVDRARFTVTVFDRSLGAPDEVAGALRDAIAPSVTELFGPDVKIAPVEASDARQAAAVHVEADPQSAVGVLEALGGAQPPLQSRWDITVEEFARLREQDDAPVVVDVREGSEYETVNLGGRLIPLASLQERLDELDRDDHIVVHCRAGNRGATAVEQLREAGFANAWNLNGALVAWRERIDPTLPRP